MHPTAQARNDNRIVRAHLIPQGVIFEPIDLYPAQALVDDPKGFWVRLDYSDRLNHPVDELAAQPLTFRLIPCGSLFDIGLGCGG